MSARSTRPTISLPVGIGLLAGIGMIAGYFMPVATIMTVMPNLSQNPPSSQLAAALLIYLLYAVLYYGAFITSVKLLQGYGFMSRIKDLHSQSRYLVYGYILLVVTNAYLNLNGLWVSTYGYPFSIAVWYGVIYAAVALATIRKG
ncbi:MAG TPA: hypothetical protein VI322_00330 [Candidatus Saccharimonadia bacterium]